MPLFFPDLVIPSNDAGADSGLPIGGGLQPGYVSPVQGSSAAGDGLCGGRELCIAMLEGGANFAPDCFDIPTFSLATVASLVEEVLGCTLAHGAGLSGPGHGLWLSFFRLLD